MRTCSTCSGLIPARSSAALMAKPPSSAALNDASAPLILPIGVRAPATMYEPGMASSPRCARRPGDAAPASVGPRDGRAATTARRRPVLQPGEHVVRAGHLVAPGPDDDAAPSVGQGHGRLRAHAP